MSKERITGKLMPLAVPAAWAIVYNTFGDEDAVIAEGRIVNDEYYTEDLLSIEQVFPNSRGWNTRKSGYILDLGWYPVSSPDGAYRLALLKGNWDNLVLELTTKDRQEVRQVIEFCLDLVGSGAERSKVGETVKAAFARVTIP